ncbi:MULTISPECIES: BTAD domain-containing putative transcriptional regulator [unclassified Rathayibacter]|uniref:AfsR/SARP family transcriptional regulator n=1 Tax=unclassified Rathayibacter TaxID=2609250 RepID=UPI000CE74359|nr:MULTISPECIES: BTAD domain-containing putative transcriptional regulator [unclassified Rathayibacter]PPI40779.1 hypothetical protein C5D50_04395 [Rathayibacter sp. RFBD1]PPI60781.1 hypothetical protein C5D38_04130 [Rathayibacter sp. TRS19]QHF21670.1 hypothetical protein GTU71_13065 [Rathayibacter sp. VKM Ac-2762]
MTSPAPRSVGFTVLGPISAVAEGADLDLGSPQQRAVLAILLLADGRPVDVDTLVDRIWGATPPRSAHGVLRTYVYRLRRVLAPHAGADGPGIETDGGWYRMPRGGVDLDLTVVERERRLARELERADDPAGAAERLGAAADRWSGTPLAGLPGEWFEDQRRRLLEVRNEIALELAGLRVGLGRHDDALPGLRRLAEERPLDEKVAALLLETLRALGRRSDALGAYDALRRRLAEQLGVSPGAALQQLHRDLLEDDPARPPAGPVALSASVARPGGTPGHAVAPAQLPPDPADFVGRAEEILRIEQAAAVGSGQGVVGITGLGGMGKTALAVHAAHRVRAAFPGGQFFVDLRAAGGHPRTAAGALLSLLEGAGVARAAVPDGFDERTALWRSVTADRPVLLLLDDAASAAQVHPLIPTGAGSLTVVTATRRLLDVTGARWMKLLPLAPEESVELMGRLVGRERLAAEPGPTARLAAACSHQPLAVRVAAARLADRPAWSVAQIEQQLYDDLDQPVVMHADCRIVDAPFRRASAGLLEDRRAAFHALSHLTEEAFSVETAAQVLHLEVSATRAVLEDLVDAHLLLDAAGGRYGFFALVRAFARRQPLRQEVA